MVEDVTIDLADSVFNIVQREAERYPNDPAEAAAQAFAKVRDLENWQDMSDAVWLRILRHFIYQVRQRTNRQIRAKTGYYRPEARLEDHATLVNAIHKSVYDYCLNGYKLGDLPLSELEAQAELQEKFVRGHRFNAKLLRTLAKDKRVTTAKKASGTIVSKVFSAKELWDYFKELGGLEIIQEEGIQASS